MHTHTHTHTHTLARRNALSYGEKISSLFPLFYPCFISASLVRNFTSITSSACTLTSGRATTTLQTTELCVWVFVRKREDGEERARREAGFLFGLQMGDIKLSLERMRWRREKACVQVVLGMRLWAFGVREKNHGSALTGVQRPTNKHTRMEQHLNIIWIHKLFKISTHWRNAHRLYNTSSSHCHTIANYFEIIAWEPKYILRGWNIFF